MNLIRMHVPSTRNFSRPTIAGLFALVLGAGPATGQFETTRISVDQQGKQAPGHSGLPSISRDGRYVAFASNSPLTALDTNKFNDVYVLDRSNGRLTLVSFGANGKVGNNLSTHPEISGNGRYVVYYSLATNLVSRPDPNRHEDIYVYDRQSGRTTLVSASYEEGKWGNGSSRLPDLSADGRYVVFQSWANNLVRRDTNGFEDVFRRDLVTGKTVRVSVGNGAVEGKLPSTVGGVSDDGRRVVFMSQSDNLVANDTNRTSDIFVRDLEDWITVRVSVDSNGVQASSSCNYPEISGDGNTVVFQSYADNLVPRDTNRRADIFAHELSSGITTRVSVKAGGIAANRDSVLPCVSRDGRFVGFSTSAGNLVPNDRNNMTDGFVHDRKLGTTTRVTVSSKGVEANGVSSGLKMTDDGQTFAFVSGASNLVPGDTNAKNDAFVSGLPVLREFVDGASREVQDYPFIDKSRITTDVARLHSGGRTRYGVVADGQSRLVVRVLTGREGFLTVGFRDMAPTSGAIAIPGGPFTQIRRTVPIVSTPRGPMGIFVFRAPTDFVRKGNRKDTTVRFREVRLDYEFTPKGSTQVARFEDAVEIHRPPVVFCHGLWSSPEAWRNRFGSVANGREDQYVTRNVDYSIVADRSFAVNARQVSLTVENLLFKMRSEDGIACSQVDWVGHSMGGLLPRYELALSKLNRTKRPWYRPDNYNSGNIHKLILINSPQWGSPMANLLVRIKNSPEGPYVDQLFEKIGLPIRGAVRDLAEGSAALKFIGASDLRCHAVVGVGPEKIIGKVGNILNAAKKLVAPISSLLFTASKFDNLSLSALYRGHRHDSIVLEPSQRAGLDPSFVTVLDGALNAQHNMVVGWDLAAANVLVLLDAPMSRFSPNLPAPDLKPKFGFGGDSGAGILIDRIEIRSPNNVTFVEPGKTVVLEVAGKRQFVPVSAALPTNWELYETSKAPLRFTVTIPKAASGEVSFFAFADNALGETAASLEFTLPVKIPSSLLSIHAGSSPVTLFEPNQTYPIAVLGEFDDEVTRRVHLASTGAQYTSSAPSVVTVSADGVLTAVSEGTAKVTVGNTALATTVEVAVEVAYGAVRPYGSGTPGSGGIVPRLHTGGELPALGNGKFELKVDDVVGDAAGVLFFSAVPRSVELLGGTVLIDLALASSLPLRVGGSSGQPGDGSTTVPLAIPSSPSLIGAQAFLQAFFADRGAPSQISFSNGLAATVTR